MTAKTLERLYPMLTVAERYPAMLAAFSRGDEVEAERLAATAPRMVVSLPDYHAHAEAFMLMIAFQQMEFLELAGWLARFKAAALGAELDGDAEDKKSAEIAIATYSWRLLLEEDAWYAFREEIGCAARDPLEGMAGHSLRTVIGNFACDTNLTTEALAGMLKKPAGDLLTVEKRVQAMRDEWNFWRDKLTPHDA